MVGSGTPLQYPCLENPMDGGTSWATIHGVSKSLTRLSDFTHYHGGRHILRQYFEQNLIVNYQIPCLRNPYWSRCTCIYIHIYFTVKTFGLPWWFSSRESACQCRLSPWEDPLKEETAIHSSILAGKIPWTEEPCGLQSMGSHKSWKGLRECACTHVRACTHKHTHFNPSTLSKPLPGFLAIKRMVSFPVGILLSKGDFLLF